MHPILFEFGGLKIGTFGVMMVTAFIVGWLLFRAEMKRKKLKLIDTDLLLAAMVGGIVGAKAYYLIEHWPAFAANPFGSIFSAAGLVWYGGVVGGLSACIIVVLLYKQPLKPYGDAVAPSLAIALALGRIG
jgi:phosphatidylglycerol:prolipoprotein diacylglycerol transferase